MDCQAELIESFYKRYLSKKEIAYRLPFSADAEEFWNKELGYRKARGTELNLHAFSGETYWYCPTVNAVAFGEKIALILASPVPDAAEKLKYDDGIAEEAFYSSLIEGAFSTKDEARQLISSNRSPADKSEQMIKNNYNALLFVKENRDAEINESFIQEIGRILTAGTLDDDVRPGYRDAGVQVVSSAQKAIYTAPDVKYVRPMMRELFAFCSDTSLHPIIRAAISQIFFLTVHPFFDGNGRTARALSYKILISSGYEIFEHFPISGLLAEERSRYYKAIMESQNSENGYDFTYFLEYYCGLLARSLEGIQSSIEKKAFIRKAERMIAGAPGAERLLRGLAMMADNEAASEMTASKWSKLLKVSDETARKDLMILAADGLIAEDVRGRKKIYRLHRDNTF